MNVTQQLDALIKLGARLDDWFTQEELRKSDLFFGEPLGDGPEKWLFAHAQQARLIDVVLARLVRIKDYTTQRPVPLIAGPAQQDYSRNRAASNIILKSGKVLFTTYLGMCAFLRVITRQGRVAVTAAHEKDFATDFFQTIHVAYQNIPGKLGEMLREGALKAQKASVRELYFPALDSRYFVETAGDAAAGLGQSYQELHCTEVSRWEGDVKQTFATLTSHMIGEQQDLTLESRPFGDHGFFHDAYQEAKTGASDLKAHFYEWWWNPGHTAKQQTEIELTEDERALAARYEAWRAGQQNCPLAPKLTSGQIGWRRTQYKKLKDQAPQEFAEDDVSCFLGSGNCPFDTAGINDILARSEAPIERETVPGAEENGWLCWEEPQEGEEYILFIDPAGGMHASRQAFEVIKRRDGAQVGEFVGRVKAIELGYKARRIGVRFNNALIAVETNLGDISVTVYQALQDYANLYRRNEANGGWKLGWKTDPATRPAMLDTLNDVLTEAPYLFKSRRLAADIRTHVRNGDRIEPAKGYTGDLTIAMAGAHSVRARTFKKREPWATAVRVERRERF